MNFWNVGLSLLRCNAMSFGEHLPMFRRQYSPTLRERLSQRRIKTPPENLNLYQNRCGNLK